MILQLRNNEIIYEQFVSLQRSSLLELSRTKSMSRDSKSPSINFDTDSSDSDSEPDLPPVHTPSPLLAPTPTMAER